MMVMFGLGDQNNLLLSPGRCRSCGKQRRHRGSSRYYQTLHTSGVEEAGLALQHLYRKASIRAEFLKGSDILLYNALVKSGDFDVCPASSRVHGGWVKKVGFDPASCFPVRPRNGQK